MNVKYLVRNSTSELFTVPELKLQIPPGTSNLYDLNVNLTFDQIEKCARFGTLATMFSNNLIHPVREDIAKVQPGVIIRKSSEPVIHPNRSRFVTIIDKEPELFTDDELGLFEDENLIPARELEAALPVVEERPQAIKTISVPASNKSIALDTIIPQPKKQDPLDVQRLKNDIKYGYRTCEGLTAIGTLCKRQAAKNGNFCGLHDPDSKKR